MLRPLISICIPTYNRAKLIDKVLFCYSQNPEVDQDVEIVVSDNNSSDETYEVIEKYVDKIPNLKINRNAENIRDKNFVTVLDLASGEYLKMHNDWVFYDAENLRFVKQCLREHLEDKLPVFFTNNWIFTEKHTIYKRCSNLDEYVSVVSTFVTSTNLFGCWRKDWKLIVDKDRYWTYRLMQVDWTYQIVQNKGCIIYNQNTLYILPDLLTMVRGGYNWFEVHLDNYYKIMQPYIERGDISKHVYENDKINLLKHFTDKLIFCVCNVSPTEKYDYSNTYCLLRNYYHSSLRLILELYIGQPIRSIFFILNKIYLRIMRSLKKKCSS